MSVRLRLALAASILALGLAGPALADGGLAKLPLTQNGGTWKAGHVQGVAVDVKGGFIYYSFTTLLAKYDFQGNLVGTLVGWTGHLGDLDFNPADGKVYGSLEYKDDKAFYIAVIDVARLDKVGVEASKTELFRTVYLPEVVKDYSADLNGDGVFEGDDGKFKGDVEASPDHRYDASGIDGVSFGPAFGHTDGKRYLTVAYGIYGNLKRTDNDHQVLLQYDISDWGKYASPLTEAAPHHNGPAKVDAKVFVRTGNTRYGVQNLAYDAASKRWFMGVYLGQKPNWPNYGLYAFDAVAQPKVGELIGVGEQGALVPLADDGLKDPATGVRGWNQKADVGIQPVGQGLFYLAVNAKTPQGQTADLTLNRWTGDAQHPFAPITAAELQKLANNPAAQ